MIKKLGTWIGTIAGVALGAFLYGIEKLTGLFVYTLLLNVDFIPGLRHAMGTPSLEWLLHLIVAWVVGILFVFVVETIQAQASPLRYLVSACLSLGAATTYVPLTMLAVQPTPAVTNWKAIGYWMVGHTLFGYVLVRSYDFSRHYLIKTKHQWKTVVSFPEKQTSLFQFNGQ